VVEHAAADDLAGLGSDRSERQQAAAFGERRQVSKRGDKLLATERG
jgi:hypothetical protein